MEDRKNMVMKARIQEYKHQLKTQLDKEKKHQWYIYRRKNYPYSRDTKHQTKLETEMDPDIGSSLPVTSRISSIPVGTLVATSVAIAAGGLLVFNRLK